MGLKLRAWLCDMGVAGCRLHKKSGYFVPFWRDPRRWLYR